MRNFMILAHYCSRTLLRERLETIRQRGSILWPRNLYQLIHALGSHFSIKLKLSLYECYLSIRRSIGLASSIGM